MSDNESLTRRNSRRARLILEPESHPWSQPVDRFGSVPDAALHPEFVRSVLGRSIDIKLDLPDESVSHHETINAPAIEAAVLIPLVVRESGVTVLLTKRTDHLHDHAGQISFPGGRVEHTDETPVATALRETHEETGLAPEHVDVLGSLPRYYTGTGFVITPITGLVRPTFTLAPDEFEVAEVFEVPLGFLTNAQNYRLHRASLPDGSERQYYSIPFEKYFIWGATAAMLRGMYQVLAAAFSSSSRS